jgi:hypothetical protein
MKRILVIAATLVVTPTAHAAVVPPIGDTACGSICVTLEASDAPIMQTHRPVNAGPPYDIANGVVRTAAGALQFGGDGCSSVNTPIGPQVPGACTIVFGTAATWQFRRYHEFRRALPYLEVVAPRFHAASTDETLAWPDTVTHYPERNTPDCNPLGENAAWLVLYPGLDGTGYIAGKDAPEAFRVACGLLTSEQAAQRVAERQAADDARIYGPVEANRRCTPVRTLYVQTRGLPCGAARQALGRYVTSGQREWRGFRCSKGRGWARCSRATGRNVIGRVRR